MDVVLRSRRITKGKNHQEFSPLLVVIVQNDLLSSKPQENLAFKWLKGRMLPFPFLNHEWCVLKKKVPKFSSGFGDPLWIWRRQSKFFFCPVLCGHGRLPFEECPVASKESRSAASTWLTLSWGTAGIQGSHGRLLLYSLEGLCGWNLNLEKEGSTAHWEWKIPSALFRGLKWVLFSFSWKCNLCVRATLLLAGREMSQESNNTIISVTTSVAFQMPNPKLRSQPLITVRTSILRPKLHVRFFSLQRRQKLFQCLQTEKPMTSLSIPLLP